MAGVRVAVACAAAAFVVAAFSAVDSVGPPFVEPETVFVVGNAAAEPVVAALFADNAGLGNAVAVPVVDYVQPGSVVVVPFVDCVVPGSAAAVSFADYVEPGIAVADANE